MAIAPRAFAPEASQPYGAPGLPHFELVNLARSLPSETAGTTIGKKGYPETAGSLLSESLCTSTDLLIRPLIGALVFLYSMNIKCQWQWRTIPFRLTAENYFRIELGIRLVELAVHGVT